MIKRHPEDFRVEELPDPEFLKTKLSVEPDAQHRHALYRLEKTSLATPEAVHIWARAWDLPRTSFSYAGLKDKHAVSSQHVAIAPPEDKNKCQKSFAQPGLIAERLGFIPEPLNSSFIAGNRFKLIVRGLQPEASADMQEAARILSLPGKEGGEQRLLFVNYFGDQRFGSARHGQGFLAKKLIRGEFEEALKLAIMVTARKDRQDVKAFKRNLEHGWGDWKTVLPKLRPCPERKAIEHLARSPKDFRGAFCTLPYFFQQLCVYAYQSHLWNSIARRYIADTYGANEATPVLAAHDPFGEMLFPVAQGVPENQWNVELAVPGHKTEYPEPFNSAAAAVLAQEGLSTLELKIPGVRRPFFGEAQRPFFVEARHFQLTAAEPDPDSRAHRIRRLTFDLPRGAYATVLLRALGQ